MDTGAFAPWSKCSIFHNIFKYTEQKWKRYTIIIYVLWESIGQTVFTKAL